MRALCAVRTVRSVRGGAYYMVARLALDEEACPRLGSLYAQEGHQPRLRVVACCHVYLQALHSVTLLIAWRYATDSKTLS